MSWVIGRSAHRRGRRLTLVIDRDGKQRHISIDPIVSLVIGIVLLLLGVWYLAATLYLVFRDDLLVSVMSRQTQVQDAYEERIATLQSTLERVTSRQLLDQDTLEGKVRALAARQAQLESRQATVATLSIHVDGLSAPAGRPKPPPPVVANSAPVDSVTVLPRSPLPSGLNAFAPAEKPHPLVEFGPLRGSGEARQSVPAGEVAPARGQRTSLLRMPEELPTAAKLERIDSAMASLEQQQIAQVRLFETQARLANARYAALLGDLGLDRSRFGGAAGAQGGPLVPVAADQPPGPFDAGVDQLQRQLAEADRMRRLTATLPLKRPLQGEMETTSGFGYRIDPFTRSMALHTGLDFRDEYGAPVRATAPGKVVTAEWSGGYGRMVEIDHGNGISTRYGHLSQITVEPGRQVQAGDIVGRLGSTGRSTGPHLHYETRVDGEAVDPLRYLRAAERFEREG